MRQISQVLFLVAFVCAFTGNAPASEPALSEVELVGIWKMCYSPGLSEVYEPSSGYLVLMPGGRYYERREDCCGDDEATDLGKLDTYVVDGRRVTFHGLRDDGTEYELALTYKSRAEVVLFDDLRGESRDYPVLTHDGRLNYGFAKVYPEPAD